MLPAKPIIKGVLGALSNVKKQITTADDFLISIDGKLSNPEKLINAGGVDSRIGHNQGPTLYSDVGAGRDTFGGMSNELRVALEEQGHLESGIAQVGRSGKLIGIPTQYSKNLKVGEDYLREMNQGLIRRDNPNIVPVKYKTPEDLEGSTVFPVFGDRSTNAEISQIGGKTLEEPFIAHGGLPYMRHQGTGDWGSAFQALTTMKKDIDKMEKEGKKVVGMFNPYAGTGSDYSMQTVDAFFALKNVSDPFTNAVSKRIDGDMATSINKFNAKKKDAKAKYPEFPGINSIEAQAYFQAYPSARKFLMENMDNSDFRKLENAPDVLALRHAISDPGLTDLRRGSVDPLVGQGLLDMSGGSVIRPSSGLPMPNNTYEGDILFGGRGIDHTGAENYLGEFDVALPMTSVHRDIIAQRRAAGTPAKQDIYEMRRSPRKWAQEMNPKTVDAMMQDREDILRFGVLESIIRQKDLQ
tara:strand:+ start:1115 stop:2518 length:1404 start_codon:yes stop_codon:yes gene_type:complete